MIDEMNLTSKLLVTLTAAAADTYLSDIQPNTNSRGVRVVFDTTTATSTSAVLTIQSYDPVSGKFADLLAGAAVTTVTTNFYTVYPGVTAASNVAASVPLGRAWRVKVAVTGGSSALTGTVSAMLCA